MLSTTNAALYGKGIFTTIAVFERKPFLWEKHWLRLEFSAAKLEIDISEHSESAVLDQLARLIDTSTETIGRARITFHDESQSEAWGVDSRDKSGLFITIAPRRKVSVNFRLSISPHRINTTSPLAGIKSCNYLEHLIAFNKANAVGFSEAVRLNERGEVASACMANIFWRNGNKLYTPSVKTGCLAGTTRELILENLECIEVEANIADLNAADDIFLTSAGIGVVQIAEFNGKAMQRALHRMLEIVPRPL